MVSCVISIGWVYFLNGPDVLALYWISAPNVAQEMVITFSENDIVGATSGIGIFSTLKSKTSILEYR